MGGAKEKGGGEPAADHRVVEEPSRGGETLLITFSLAFVSTSHSFYCSKPHPRRSTGSNQEKVRFEVALGNAA